MMKNRDGQAMVEFLLGLVGILFLLLGISFLAEFVSKDFDNFYAARMDVADVLSGKKTKQTQDGSADVFQQNNRIYNQLEMNIKYSDPGGYEDYLSAYYTDSRADGFGFISRGTDPLVDTLVSSIRSDAVYISSSLLAQLLGSDRIRTEVGVAMPELDGLMQ